MESEEGTVKVFVVESSYGSYDTADRAIIAVYSTAALADAHQRLATEWRDENIRPLLKKLSRRWDSDLATEVWNLSQRNPWDPNGQSGDFACSYYFFEEEVLEELPKV